MSKEDKKNLITWTLLCILSFTLFGIGFIKNLQGYGKNGRIRNELNPIVKKFNSLEEIKSKDNADIKAKYKKKKIIVNYETDRVSLEFTFDYEEVNNTKLIKVTYNDLNSDIAEIVVKNMMDAISILNGNNEGEIFKKYKYDNFYETNITHGAQLINKNGSITAQLAINTNILKNIENLTFDETNINYISTEELSNLKQELSNKPNFLLVKGNITLYVVETNNKYIIYLSDISNNQNDVYNSLMSTIALLDSSVYNDIINAKVNLTQEIKRKNYEIKINPDKIENNQEIPGSQVIKLTITK